jgi:CRISPR-associated protein (TIGR03986 family)
VGSTFHGRIRFENLSKEELGALLFVLDLPEGCAHKLGMGKPLGLGSVRITPTLTLINRQARYAEMFDSTGNWFTGETSQTDLTPYKDAFAKYIGAQTNQFGIIDAASYWANDPRMKELKHMLTFENNPGGISWEDRTRYMEIEHPLHRNEYKNRPVLPKPSEVVQKDTYKES